MSTTLQVGDWQIPTLTVSPHDGTTTATLTVVSPLGVTTTPAATTSDSGATWTAEGYELAAGEWVERWTVTGTGKGKETRVLLVAPDPTDLPPGRRVYATTADYARAINAAPPAGTRRALVEASGIVDEMLLTAVYATDVNGLPTDAAVTAALRDATCAQAEYSRATGDRNAVGASQLHSFSIGSISATRGYSSTGSTAPGRWSLTAWSMLQRAGLTTAEPWAW